MARFSIDVSEFLDFAEQMGAAESKLKANLLAAAGEVAGEGASIARQILAENDSVVTGDLSDSIIVQGTGMTGNTVWAEYGPGEQYPAHWVEYGRPAVHAKRAKFLKFQIKGTGPYLYRKSVGPAPPRPFMKPSVARLRPFAVKKMGEAAMRSFK